MGVLFFLSHDKVIPRKGFQKGRIIMKTAVIAIGGNAIIMEGQKGTIEEQFENVSKSCDHIIDLLEEGYNVVLTHGNGPHVGNSLIKGEAGKDLVPAYPMDACGAETQGLLGYAINYTKKMGEITTTENPNVTIPILNFQGIPTGIDLRKVLETGVLPLIDTAIAHKEPGIGMIGAGVVNPPMECFKKAALALAKRIKELEA